MVQILVNLKLVRITKSSDIPWEYCIGNFLIEFAKDLENIVTLKTILYSLMTFNSLTEEGENGADRLRLSGYCKAKLYGKVPAVVLPEFDFLDTLF